MMTARCDCPKGVNGKLPSGQTFNRDRVNGLGSFGVEVNIVEDGTLVPMEIQVPDRFKEKNFNSNER